MSMTLIGTGLIAIGIMVYLLLQNNPATTTQDFSVVPAEVDFAAPDLPLEDLEGNPVSLDDYLGQVVLVNL